MSDSLRAMADSVADSVARVAVAAKDSIDWVQECAYRQAMLIERIDFWMDMVAGMFWAGMFCFIIYATYRSVKDFRKVHKKPPISP
jgi:hypothetical protein